MEKIDIELAKKDLQRVSEFLEKLEPKKQPSPKAETKTTVQTGAAVGFK